MSEQNLSVLPGVVSYLNVNLAEGSTIYNGSTSSSVWVSEQPAITPGIGTRIAPFGSLRWTKSTALYACVDTGVVDAVPLVISGNVDQLSDPYGIATAINSLGVPNPVVTEVIQEGVVTGSQLLIPNIERFASLIIRVFDVVISSNVGMLYTNNYDSVTMVQTPMAPPIVVGPQTYIVYQVPVLGDQVQLSFELPGTYSIKVTGTNRVLPFSMLGPDTMVRSQLNTAYGTSGTFIASMYSGGGLANLWLESPTANLVRLGYQKTSGNLFLGSNLNGYARGSSTVIQQQILLPPGAIRLAIFAQVAGTYTVYITLTMTGS